MGTEPPRREIAAFKILSQKSNAGSACWPNDADLTQRADQTKGNDDAAYMLRIGRCARTSA